MTKVIISVDTELSALLYQQGMDVQTNLDRSIWGRCRAGAFGIGWQMDMLEQFGLKGVFFVDPLPALIYGGDAIAEIVQPIIARGHEVQLHMHTEWLAWAVANPVAPRTGRDVADFCLADQQTLLALAADLLERAGAPRPTTFRAGNYGANDDTLHALAALGFVWDTSVNPAFLGKTCHISVSASQIIPVRQLGITELPVSAIFDRAGHLRPAQICAFSAREMKSALHHALRHDHPAFMIVTHSFEMLTRDRMRPNRMVMRRFGALCEMVATTPELTSAGFADLDPVAVPATPETARRLGPNRVRTALRLAEQAFSTMVYERSFRAI